MGLCLADCDRGEAAACYWLALALQEANVDGNAVAALFHRACRLGKASACTNLAANRLPQGDPFDTCSARTFGLACARGDPWGCTMHGTALSKGEGVPRDLDAAVAAFQGSCRFGLEDPACRTAIGERERVLALIRKERGFPFTVPEIPGSARPPVGAEQPSNGTTDLAVGLPRGVTVGDVVGLVLADFLANVPRADTLATLRQKGLSQDDAAIAWDRARGGALRAAISPRSIPSAEKDPIAYESFVRASKEPALLEALRR